MYASGKTKHTAPTTKSHSKTERQKTLKLNRPTNHSVALNKRPCAIATTSKVITPKYTALAYDANKRLSGISNTKQSAM